MTFSVFSVYQVNSYNPRTTFGEHQFFVYIKAQDAVITYLPIVPVRSGDIEVSVRATTLIASDRVTRVLTVEVRKLLEVEFDSVQLFENECVNFDPFVNSLMAYLSTDTSRCYWI